MSAYLNLYIGNHNVVELQGLTNSVTEAIDTGATVTVTLTDSSGAAIDGQTWPASMVHVSAGLYRATLEPDLDVVDGQNCVAIIEATGSAGEVGRWEIAARAEVRDL